MVHQIPRRRSISMTISSSALSPKGEDVSQRMTRALSETDLRDYSAVSKKKPPLAVKSGEISKTTTLVEEVEGEETSLDRLLSSSGLDEEREIGARDGEFVCTSVDGGIGGVGGRICGGGGGGGGGSDGGDGDGNDSTDVYYRKMIEVNPNNALFLGNYAKFLKEVEIERFCKFFILDSPDNSLFLMHLSIGPFANGNRFVEI